jgi:hypothetical protein
MKRSELPIASPCAANWDTMTPRGRALFCDECKTLVHDLSQLRRAEAAEFMKANVGEQLCIKYSFDVMGNVQFADAAATAVIPANMLRPSVRALAAATALLGANALYQRVTQAPQTLVMEQPEPAAPLVLVAPLVPAAPALGPESEIASSSYGRLGGAISVTADLANALDADEHQPPPSTVTLGTVTVAKGGYDPAVVRRYFRRNQAKFHYCYEKQRLTNPELEGSVDVSFAIANDGTTSDVAAAGVDPEIDTCFVGIVKNIEFPRPKADGFAVQVPIKLKFRK